MLQCSNGSTLLSTIRCALLKNHLVFRVFGIEVSNIPTLPNVSSFNVQCSTFNAQRSMLNVRCPIQGTHFLLAPLVRPAPAPITPSSSPRTCTLLPVNKGAGGANPAVVAVPRSLVIAAAPPPPPAVAAPPTLTHPEGSGEGPRTGWHARRAGYAGCAERVGGE